MSRRKKPYKPLIPSSTPGSVLLRHVEEAVEANASWDDRILAAIMLVDPDCNRDEALQALRQSLDFYGAESFNEYEMSASFARGTVNLAAERVQQRRAHEEWVKRTDALLAARKSKLRVVLGGVT